MSSGAFKGILFNNRSLFLYFSQNSDTESCDMLNVRRLVPTKQHSLASRKDSGEMSGPEREDGHEDQNDTRGAVGHRERRHLQSVDSNHLESQSEWSDDDLGRDGEGSLHDKSEESFSMYPLLFPGGAESTGYLTDEPGLENVSLLNEAGLTDAEGALSDVNSLYNAPDVDDTSVSSRASSRLLSLDSLSGLYDCDLDSKHEMAIVSASHKITSKFGPPS